MTPVVLDNYFLLFDLPVAFALDAAALKKSYYRKSREFHPDFFTSATPEEQAEAARMTEYINTAFATLSEEGERTRYILSLLHKDKDLSSVRLPEDFLFQMMDINERISDDGLNGAPADLAQILEEVSAIETEWRQQMDHWTVRFDTNENKEESLQYIGILYLKSRYLLRIHENLATFAAP